MVLAVLLLALAMFSREIVARTDTVMLQGLPLSRKIVVIDPGHGGYDPGVTTGSLKEKDIVLAISLILRDYLQSGGAYVVMTREQDNDLLILPTAGPKKTQDMKNRKEIINNANPDLVISVHVNSISSSRWRGAQVFYSADSNKSKRIALLIQDELTRVLKNTNRSAKPGQYYIVNETNATAVLVEAGFISNSEEAKLLTDKDYQQKVAWAIYMGINRYFSDTVYQ